MCPTATCSTQGAGVCVNVFVREQFSNWMGALCTKGFRSNQEMSTWCQLTPASPDRQQPNWAKLSLLSFPSSELLGYTQGYSRQQQWSEHRTAPNSTSLLVRVQSEEDMEGAGHLLLQLQTQPIRVPLGWTCQIARRSRYV